MMNSISQRPQRLPRATALAAALLAISFLLPSGASSVPILIPNEQAFVDIAEPGQSSDWQPFWGSTYRGDGFAIRSTHGEVIGIHDWESTREGLELAISSHESMVITFDTPRTSFGLDVFDGSAVNSNWDVIFYNNGEVVFETIFEGVPDQWSFFGVMLWGCEFDRVHFLEDNASPENDYFGNFYAGGADEGLLAGLPL